MRSRKVVTSRIPVCFFFFFLFALGSLQGQEERCLSLVHREALVKIHPGYTKQAIQIEAFTKEWIRRNAAREKSGEVFQIPVVVHVVWHEMAENISDEQISSQIAVLNRDFLALNVDLALVPEEFRSLIADTGISFCLAQVDPDGFPTSGITRTFTSYANVGTDQDESGRFRIYYTEAGGQDAWDTERYLNIWVARRGYGSGLASFPGVAPAEEDGLVIDDRFFGDTGTAADNQPYHLGRTVTHELGHYFNLLHPWGAAAEPDCESDDRVEDTPRQDATYLRQCPQDQPVTCGTADFFFNYMNYTDDACMAMFTLGQKMRMLAALEGPRSGLLAGGLCGEVSPVTQAAPEPPVRVWNDGHGREWRVALTGDAGGLLQCRLYNLLGQRFWQQVQWVHSGQMLLLPPVASGVYLLHLQWQGRTYVQKIVIHQ